ncbi:Isochorismatase hydrolase [Lophiostoma macrostomum CBS 122681]|uniref:Isochorismatase hydrolase n=1 Tax=Lophiostoma macrostomum CBS 122681 TaxID=1314788 RepID=A0A6A6TCL4_9PLEO|nr:Isochorismatase hydrolase [Lophiostoma macrostomum CBS 122681]
MKTALLIIDMQEFFRSMTESALPNILKLTDYFSIHDMPRIFTQHGHPPSDFKPPITNQVVRKWGKDGCLHKDSPGWELMTEIAALTPSCPLIHKNVYDAFMGLEGKGLEEMLREMAVERVVICGVMTDCCCDATARSAFNRGFETWMVGDAMGSVDQRQHEAALKAFDYGYGPVLRTKDVLRKLKRENSKDG